MRHVCGITIVLGCLVLACDSSDHKAPTDKGTPNASRPATQPGDIALFNGRDLANWKEDLDDPKVKMQEVWSVLPGGVLRCKGRPAGVLRTDKEYSNYTLALDWRWLPETGGGNNGVLVHASTPRTLGIWPKSIEVQLESGNAGDFWVIGTSLEVPDEGERRQGRRFRNFTDESEKPIGEWNTIEITCRGNEITVKVNGELVNHATNCSVSSGAICLQSEGTPIEYRSIYLHPE